MKKWMIFGAGVITGILALLLIKAILAYSKTNGGDIDNEITWFDEPGEVFDESALKVFYVLAKHDALVEPAYAPYLNEKVYLLVNDEEKYYYDNEIVKVPEGYQLRQMGIFRYPTQDEEIRTVPVVKIIKANNNRN
jgi:hypothetical protein